MSWKQEWKAVTGTVVVFLACFFLPGDAERFQLALTEALALVRWYAREHVLTCLVPAFFIAGAIAIFVRRDAVIRYLGPRAPKAVSYGVASVSGTVLAVCSCTVLPLFAGIYRRGAGLGPATTFLYAGPAVNALAIILTARILGLELGIARAAGAILFAVVIGIVMQFLFRGEELRRAEAGMSEVAPPPSRPLWQNGSLLAAMVAILLFANWAAPENGSRFWLAVHEVRWIVVSLAGAILAGMLIRWFRIGWWKLSVVAAATLLTGMFIPDQPVLPFTVAMLGLAVVLSTEPGEPDEWLESSWELARMILPLLLAGVLVSGLLLGRPGGEGLIPSEWVQSAVGGNGIRANLLASVVGAFMYFATLTEVPILLGLIENGMGKGPALALLLAGPALSLPNMLVIRGVLGWRKTLTYVALVVLMSTASGMLFGMVEFSTR